MPGIENRLETNVRLVVIAVRAHPSAGVPRVSMASGNAASTRLFTSARMSDDHSCSCCRTMRRRARLSKAERSGLSSACSVAKTSSATVVVSTSVSIATEIARAVATFCRSTFARWRVHARSRLTADSTPSGATIESVRATITQRRPILAGSTS